MFIENILCVLMHLTCLHMHYKYTSGCFLTSKGFLFEEKGLAEKYPEPYQYWNLKNQIV